MSQDEDDRMLLGCLHGFTFMFMGLFFLLMVLVFVMGFFGMLPDA